MQFKNKKISFVLILFSLLMLVFGLMTKDYDNHYYRKNKYEPPLNWYDVSLFGLEIDYKSYMLIFILILGIGVYLLIFKTDKQLKSVFLTPKMNLSKVTDYKEKLDVLKPNQVHNTKKTNKFVIKIVEVVILLALFFTFYMGVKTGFSLWFFIILSYFYYLVWKPKSMKQILLKAILYPLIFMVLFTFSESSRVIYFNFFYQISKHILPYLVSVVIIFFTQKHKLNNQPSFSYRSPLFWISIICIGIAVLRLVVDNKLGEYF